MSTIQNTRLAAVGLGGHDLLDEAAERHDPGLLLTAADQLAAVDVPSGQVAQRAAAVVVVLDAHRRPGPPGASAWQRRRAWMLGLLIGADHELGCSSSPLKRPGIQVKETARPSRKRGSRGKIHDRWSHGRIASSESQRAIVDADASTTARSITSRCSSAPVEARQRHAQDPGQLARDRLDLRDLLRGENGADDPRADDPLGPQGAPARNRLRHFAHASGAVSSRPAISTLVKPSAA